MKMLQELFPTDFGPMGIAAIANTLGGHAAFEGMQVNPEDKTFEIRYICL